LPELLETRIGTCTVALAAPEDAPTVIALRDDAARWLQDRGIEQWSPGELPVIYFQRLIAEHATWLLRQNERVVGVVSVTWSEPEIWVERDIDQSGYIRGLVIDRQLVGNGLGRDLLDWAEAHIAASARNLARLDCVRTNRNLRLYYERAGYRHVGYKDFPEIDWAREAALYEKRLGADHGVGAP
jgi:ribosomal protein S18 acetylase RimI-like enzyme